MQLPEAFTKPDERGFSGAVECAFLSTTTDLKVAAQYSGGSGSQRLLFQIDVGQIDCGADISDYSQYQAESEVLFPPLTNLEAVGSRMCIDECGDFKVVLLRANINQKALTVDEVRSPL